MTPIDAFARNPLHGFGVYDSRATDVNDALRFLGASMPSTYNQLRKHFVNAVAVGRKETGKKFTGGQTNINLGKIPVGSYRMKDGQQVTIPDPKKVGPLFGYLKKILIENGATKTAQAFTQSASWYYYNVELPNSPQRQRGASSSGSGASLASSDASSLLTGQAGGRFQQLGKGKKIALIVGGVLLLGGIAYFAFAPTKPVKQ